MYINGHGVVTDIKVNDGYWHFLCITWENTNGSWNIFLDGILKDTGTNLAKGLTIPGRLLNIKKMMINVNKMMMIFVFR